MTTAAGPGDGGGPFRAGVAVDGRLGTGVALVASLLLVALAAADVLPAELGGLVEMAAVVTGGWTVWLLSRNRPLGWWVGLVSSVLFAVIFARVRLFAEVGIQVVYVVTSLQAIRIWLRGGADRSERRVGWAPDRWLILTVPIFLVALVLLRQVLIEVNGAAPFWDALTTVLSLTAHVYLMWRFVNAWYLWVVVDIIYVPLYASRGLYLTAGLYVVFLLMAVGGLLEFRRLAATAPAVVEPA